MGYTPTTWNTGDTITASALNKMEQGIADGGGALFTTYDASISKLDKTVQEIYDALESGTPVYVIYKYGSISTDFISHSYYAPIIKIYTYDNTDIIRIVATWTHQSGISSGDGSYLHAPSVVLFSANSLDDYPTFLRRVQVKSSSLESVQNIY